MNNCLSNLRLLFSTNIFERKGHLAYIIQPSWPKHRLIFSTFAVIKSVNDDHYIINGEGGLSSSGIYEYDGVTFDYQWTNFTKSEKLKKDVFESIYATGPLLKAVDILVRRTGHYKDASTDIPIF